MRTITGIGRTGARLTLHAGDRVLVHGLDGRVYRDTVREGFLRHVLLEPYGRNYTTPAVVLTETSNADIKDIEGVL